MSIQLKGLPLIHTGKEVRKMVMSNTEYWVQRFIPKRGRTLIVGKPKLGKTHLIIQMLACAVAGVDFLDFRTKKCVVLYLSFDKAWLTPMVQRLTNDIDNDALDNFFIVKWEIPTPLYLDKASGYDQLAKLTEATKPDIIVLDPKVLTMCGNEDSVEDNVKWMQNADKLQANYPVTLVPIHHVPKGAKSTDIIDLPRGSSALAGWADVVVSLKKKAPSFRTVEVISRYEQDPEPLELEFRGKFSIAPEEEEKKVKFQEAVVALMNSYGKVKPTELVKKVAEEVGISESYCWQAWDEAKSLLSKDSSRVV